MTTYDQQPDGDDLQASLDTNSLVQCWRQWMSLVTEYPAASAPYTGLSASSDADLLGILSRSSRSAGTFMPSASALPEPTTTESVVPETARPPVPASFGGLSPAPPFVSPGLGSPRVPLAQQSVTLPPLPAPHRPFPAEQRLPLVDRGEQDVAGFPSAGDPLGHSWRTQIELSDQRRHDTVRQEQLDTYKQQAELDREYRATQLQLMKRIMDDTGNDYRQLLDVTYSYEQTRDTLTDVHG